MPILIGWLARFMSRPTTHISLGETACPLEFLHLVAQRRADFSPRGSSDPLSIDYNLIFWAVVRRLAGLLTLGGCMLPAQTPPPWSVAQDSHFAVYSQAGEKTAEKGLLWLEQLRAFFQQNGLFGVRFDDKGQPPLRVIGFSSEAEFAEYRIRALAEAYYSSYENRGYIVLATLQPTEFRVAAHEYAHSVIRTSELKLPPCFHEGLAEFFSTLQVRENGFELGGDLPARKQTLERSRGSWLPLADLLTLKADSALAKDRKGAEIFYSESWALTYMLISSIEYGPHFRELVAAFNKGLSAAQAFQVVYGKSLTETERDLEKWVAQTHAPRLMLSQPAGFDAPQTSQLSTIQAGSLLADLSFVIGHLEQAKLRYQELARQEPGNPDFPAALGNIAHRQGHQDEALRFWRQAINKKTNDAELCYRYAVLVDDADPSGGAAVDAKAALERALLLAPGFDNAHYKLALVQYRSGEYSSAVDHLRAMKVPEADRRYAYWIALASALLELNDNDGARHAAQEGANAAQNDSDRMAARRLALIAATDSKVQFVTDSDGRAQIVTTRVPHGTAADWNPFIEPSDQMQHTDGKLSEVLCEKNKLTGFLLHTSHGPVAVDVPDPLHVLMRNSPSEFYCGPSQEKAVVVDYAVVKIAGKTRNVLRGMTF